MKKTVEPKAEESTQAERSEIQIGERKYQIAPASVSTIIEVSELVAKLPQVELDIQRGTFDSLLIAKECKVLGDIVAVLVFGVDRICKEQRTVPSKPHWWSKETTKTIEVDAKAELAKQALSMGPANLNETIVYLLSKMELNAFFALTSSLIEVNMLRPTKQ